MVEPFNVRTDHKPLQNVVSKRVLVMLLPRIQRMMMTLVKYPDMTLKIRFQRKSLKMADTLSRAPLISQNAPETKRIRLPSASGDK